MTASSPHVSEQLFVLQMLLCPVEVQDSRERFEHQDLIQGHEAPQDNTPSQWPQHDYRCAIHWPGHYICA
ncbi:hypothetical protein COCON_G00063300 [Conger conger]|uniref:Uncharacterized protein n=1 Tax=Conger conger TaxID=82655 RepID=A0A9Q1DS43_CONCO|nr:hypothetical protein COCON_G00063300 [Conger conger]